MTVKSIDKQYVLNTYNRFDLHLVEGKGSVVKDENGKEYIDLTTGIGVTAFGIADEKWVEAVTAQLTTLQHTSNLYYTTPCAMLAKAICEKTDMSKVFFSNSGAEANECAIKVARKYAMDKGYDRYNILTLNNSFHGRTLATLSATGQQHYHELFNPLPTGFVHADANDIDGVISTAKENNVCAIMIECVQGEGGVIKLDTDFVKAIYSYAVENDILFIVDEVQTGNGRTGELYAYMNYSVKPDIFTTAKGLGGGLPIGACVVGEKAQNVLGFGDHGSTYGGNPVACAGALSVFERLTDKLLAEVKYKSQYVFDALSKCDGVESVSGMGLMIGIKTKKPVGDVIKECMRNGVLTLSAKDKLRLLPALNIDFEILKKAVDVIKSACEI
ncbi:MAG: acetylornithine/succinylornithine family transaminase [Ruminococcus sp.]|nr:acetylornithine/succinylornithine family transaminase [Ruminococcus sp.]